MFKKLSRRTRLRPDRRHRDYAVVNLRLLNSVGNFDFFFGLR
jgi:hypothetical protein